MKPNVVLSSYETVLKDQSLFKVSKLPSIDEWQGGVAAGCSLPMRQCSWTSRCSSKLLMPSLPPSCAEPS